MSEPTAGILPAGPQMHLWQGRGITGRIHPRKLLSSSESSAEEAPQPADTRTEITYTVQDFRACYQVVYAVKCCAKPFLHCSPVFGIFFAAAALVCWLEAVSTIIASLRERVELVLVCYIHAPSSHSSRR